MTYATSLPQGYTLVRLRRPRRRVSRQSQFGSAVLALGALFGASVIAAGPTASPHSDEAQALPPRLVKVSNAYVALLDPGYSLGIAPAPLEERVPLRSSFQPLAAPPLVAAAQPETLPSAPDSTAPAPVVEAERVVPTPIPVPDRLVESVPLPMQRPTEFRVAANPRALRASARRTMEQNRTVALRTAPPDNRNFIEKLFGMAPQPSGPALGYAAPEDGFFGGMRGLAPAPTLPYDRWTAVYDIAAHTVYLPSGAKLEAHSGLGARLDDPRSVHERNRGATPPNVYDLQPREQLFHGVQALRLNPVGGAGTFGRNGLLAHSYMLGPNGDSNGCVSFRDYSAFLQAYQNGEIRRLAVVARLN